jgi:hypothetical protein
VRSLLGRIVGGSRAPQDPFLNFEERLMQQIEGLRVAPEPRPEEMAALVRGQDNGNRLQILRDKPYYEWRYRNPRSTYRFVFDEGGDGLDGFVVLQQPSRGGDVAIVDWQFADTSRGVQLLRAVTEALEARRLSIWSLTLPPELREGLLSIGFRPENERDTKAHPARGLILTSTHAGTEPAEWSFDGASLVTPEAWDLRMINSDFY